MSVVGLQRGEKRREAVRGALELVRDEVAEVVKGTFLAEAPVAEVSAVTGEGVTDMLGKLVEYLSVEAEEAKEAQETEPIPTPARKSLRPAAQELVYQEQDGYRIESEPLERLAAMVDLRDQRVILQLWREMTKSGVARRLAELGIEAGDTIRIGRFEVEWF